MSTKSKTVDLSQMLKSAKSSLDPTLNRSSRPTPLSKSSDKITIPHALLASFMQRMDQLESQVEILSAMKNMSQKRIASSYSDSTSLDNFEVSIELCRKVDEMQNRIREMDSIIRRQSNEITLLKQKYENDSFALYESSAKKLKEVSPSRVSQERQTIAPTEKESVLKNVRDFVNGIEMSSLIDHLHEQWLKDLETTQRKVNNEWKTSFKNLEHDLNQRIDSIQADINTRLQTPSKFTPQKQNGSVPVSSVNLLDHNTPILYDNYRDGYPNRQNDSSLSKFNDEPSHDTLFQDTTYQASIYPSSQSESTPYMERKGSEGPKRRIELSLQGDQSPFHQSPQFPTENHSPNFRQGVQPYQPSKSQPPQQPQLSSKVRHKSPTTNNYETYGNQSNMNSNHDPNYSNLPHHILKSPRNPDSPTSRRTLDFPNHSLPRPTAMSKWLEESKTQRTRGQSPGRRVGQRFDSPVRGARQIK